MGPIIAVAFVGVLSLLLGVAAFVLEVGIPFIKSLMESFNVPKHVPGHGDTISRVPFVHLDKRQLTEHRLEKSDVPVLYMGNHRISYSSRNHLKDI